MWHDWRCVNERHEEIASALAEQYDVDPEIAHRDVTATLARLKELNLVTGP